MSDIQTNSIYLDLQYAYNFYNEKLFEGKLESALMTLQRQKNMLGYICFDRFSEKNGQKYMHELAMNSDYFAYRTTIQTLSTLVHEQCHLYQRQFGTPSRQSYHDHEFKDIMMSIGLVTSVTGKPDGKPVGQKMDHYIHKSGKFLEASIELLDMGFELPIYERHTPPYINPKHFYREALEFIEDFEGILKPEYLRPLFLNEILLKKAQQDRDTDRMIASLINKKDAVAKPEPVTTVEDGDDDLEDTETIESIEDVMSSSAEVVTEEYREPEPIIELKVESIEDIVEPIKALLSSSEEEIAVVEQPKPAKNKCKYMCTTCKTNIWGKPNLNVICGECEQPFMLCN